MQSAQPNPGSPHQPETHPGAARTLRWALWSLLCWFGSPVALYMGLKAKREIEATPGRYSNARSGALAVVLGGVGTALLVTSAVAGALMDDPNPSAPASAAPAPSEVAPSPPAPSPSATPSLAEARPVAPSNSALGIEAEYEQLFKTNPAGDHYSTIATRHSMTKEAVLEEISQVAEYRSSLQDQLDKALAKASVIGDLKVSAVGRTELGVYTAALALTVVRCPDGRPETDEALRTLFEDGLKKVVGTLPTEIDAFQAALLYRGMSCERGSVGYGATWTRTENVVELK